MRPSRLNVRSASEVIVPFAASASGVLFTFHLLGLSAPLGEVVCIALGFVVLYGVSSWRTYGILETRDRMAQVWVWGASALALLPLLLIIYYVATKGGGVVLSRFPRFHFLLTDLHHWDSQLPPSQAGMLHAIIGTVEQVGIASLLTVPVSILTAVYLNEIGGRFAGWVRAIVDAMSGIPSIIAGLFIYEVWVFPRHQNGHSGFAGSMALAILMIPTITRTAEEVLRIVPGSLREASLALGAPEWRTILRVVLPTARIGLITAVILGVARAVGETAPVLFTIFGSDKINLNPFHGAQSDLTLQVFQLILAPTPNSVKVAWGGAFVLVVLILTLFTLTRLLGAGQLRGPRRPSWARRRSTPPAAQ